MKKLIFIFLLLGVAVHSQENKYEKIKALKTAYITEQLGLTSSEAEKFWPVYNSFDTKFQDLRQRKHDGIHQKSFSEIESMNEEEANKLIDEYLSVDSDELDLQRRKIAALRKVISPKKIVALRKAEDDFKRELLNKYRQGKEKNQPLGNQDKKRH